MTSSFERDTEPKLGRRKEQGLATRSLLLDAAVASLIEGGVSKTTTLEVQRRARSSRGALLHHFSSHAELLSATVEELVRRNERGAAQTRAGMHNVRDPVERAIKTLAAIVAQPSYMAELELWAAARTDKDLLAALVAAERGVRKDSERVLAQVFAPVRDRPGYEVVVELSLEFLRGLALSGVLRRSPARRNRLLMQWVWAARILLDRDPAVSGGKRDARTSLAVP
jgi:AcrR family transcriptional regulator